MRTPCFSLCCCRCLCPSFVHAGGALALKAVVEKVLTPQWLRLQLVRVVDAQLLPLLQVFEGNHGGCVGLPKVSHLHIGLVTCVCVCVCVCGGGWKRK